MSVQEVRQSAEQKMNRSFDSLKASLSKIRTGRAHTGLLENLTVDYYGNPTPLSQVATLTLLDARTIGVSPWEKKMVATVEKAIRDSDLGLNPASHGEIIRVPMPALTEERRRDLAKLAAKYAEQQKIAVRNVRRDANDDLKKAEKAGEISQDDQKRMETEVQKDTDAAIKRIDEALKVKEAEIMQV